jgi:lysyl-tRNA synthetase class 2
MMEKTSELIQKRKDKFDQLKQNHPQLFPNDFRVSHTINEIHAILDRTPEMVKEDGPIFNLAGRMMAINRFGKSAFIRFRDRSGQLQAYIRKDRIGFCWYQRRDV